MGFLTRRQDPQPVQVRRPPAEPLPPVTVVVPNTPAPGVGASSAGVSSNPSHVTQNFFYAAPPAPVPPATPQALVFAPPHIQTTIHHHYARPKERKLSFSGTVGMALGALGCAASFSPASRPFALWLCLAGAAAGGLGLFSSVLLGLTRMGAPLLAVLFAGVGAAMAFNSGGVSRSLEQAGGVMPHVSLPAGLIPSVRRLLPTIVPPSSSASTAAKPAPSQVQPTRVPQPPKPAEDPGLEAKRQDAARRLGIDYSAVLLERADAAASLAQARVTLPPGSAALVQADQRFLTADAALAAVRHKLDATPALPSP